MAEGTYSKSKHTQKNVLNSLNSFVIKVLMYLYKTFAYSSTQQIKKQYLQARKIYKAQVIELRIKHYSHLP